MVRVVSMLWFLLCLACGPGSEGEMDTTSAAPEPKPRFLVLQKLGNSVAFYTLDGKLTTTIPVGKNPHEMIVSEDGRLAYVTDYGARGVEEESEGGTTVTVIDVAEQKKVGVEGWEDKDKAVLVIREAQQAFLDSHRRGM